jgi:dual-specificity kinase
MVLESQEKGSGKYKILGHLGDGTFGRALQCVEMSENRIYAVKVIRAVARYTESAKTEA